MAGDVRAIARAASLIESGTDTGRVLVELLRPFTGRARTIGLTGPPGAGKSTLANAMTRVLRELGMKAGVIAVDPSSPVSGGALLGDRIRMQEHNNDEGVFVRSLATRGHKGGLAAATFEVSELLDAAGFEAILIETVGAGQDEVDIWGRADVTILVLVPGLGDDVQIMKAGIVETADIFAINKSDRAGAELVEQTIRQMQSLTNADEAAPVRRVVATEGVGVDELVKLALEAPSRRRRSHASLAFAGNVTIDHLGIAVNRIQQALEFYEHQLGLTPMGFETVPGEKVNVAMLPVGDARIELLEASSADSTIAKFIEKRGAGLHHVALKVDDLASAVEQIRKAGGRIVNEPARGAGGHCYVFVHPASTGGVLLELIQR
ncbi:MAG: methylmalonyl Co-A mutase-associated GTPase MeaB [Bryobacteraceae bacterium]